MQDRGSGKAGAVVLGAGVGGILTYILTSTKKAKAAPAPEGVDEETWQLLISILEAQAMHNEALLVAINNLTVTLGGEATIENPNSIDGGRILCPTALTAKQLPSVPVPFGMSVIVKGLKNNVNDIYVAKSKQDAQNANTSYPLVANEFVEYEVDDVSGIWIAAETAGEGIAWTVEQRKGR